MAHAYYPSYAGGGDWEDLGLTEIWTTSWDGISTSKPGMMDMPAIPTTWEVEKGGSKSKVGPGKKCEIWNHILKIT
jgi:hypothetical protein